MASIPMKYEELLQAAAADLKALLWSERIEDEKIVQKGLLLYRQGLVSKAKLENDFVTASVQDVTRVHVELDLNFLNLSTCSCPTDGTCRHILAVFFYAYSQVGSVAEWVEDWRQPAKEKKSAETWGLQRAKDLLKTAGALQPDYDSWVSSFREDFDSIMKGTKNPKPYLVPDLFQVYSRKLKASAPVKQEWKQLYYIVAAIHSFQQLLNLSRELDHQEADINRHYRHLFFSIIDEIEELVEKLSVHAMPFAFDEFIARLKDDCIYLLAEDFDLEFERTHLYVVLWTKLYKKKGWREQETKKLQELYEQTHTVPLLLGSAHQHIMLRDDDRALKILQHLEEEAAPYMLFWLEMLKASKDWKRMGPFVDIFANMLQGYIKELHDTYARMEFTRWALKAVSVYCIENHKFDLYEKILVQTLPYSYRIYDDFLFEQKQYDKWSDLQVYIGYDISSLSNDKLKALQKEEPTVLLPLYHQSVQQQINLKNRSSYRVAVKHLKKLRTIYKKLKREDDWQQFLSVLLENTKRLRAFQEECERGKLINA
ncbi:SWIM zinc finger family protein [Bacillus dakarensis]|uniref:SWIM zinc finger family protein n=1 Tax=Robertmurraya dakarensis TaxID=1926278 RepID=UPI001F33E785|nr:SWIM zinc finger family protein [Bacillus dakarensis]